MVRRQGFEILKRLRLWTRTHHKHVLVVVVIAGGVATPKTAAADDYTIRGRIVEPGSYWTRLARPAPLDPHSDEDVAYWASHSSNVRLRLAGSTRGGIGRWSFATCYGAGSAPVWRVRASSPRATTFYIHCRGNVTRRRLRVAPGDNMLVMFDLRKRVMLRLTGSVTIHQASHRIVASNWNYRKWRDNGLDRALGGCARCLGHRGFDSTYSGVRFDEAKAGHIPHVVRITVPSSVNSPGYVWPFVHGAYQTRTGIIPSGTRMRLQEAAYHRLLDTYANRAKRAIIEALYEYGAIITDGGSHGVTIMLENTRGAIWRTLGIRSASALDAIKITDFEEVERGWRG